MGVMGLFESYEKFDREVIADLENVGLGLLPSTGI